MQGKKNALETQLQEKEQLIGALTQRLEQAAEQLDRIHRTGGDRGLRQAGLPPELVEQHQVLVEDLQRAVQQWEDMQAAASLGRIEVQISELRDLVAGQGIRPQSADAGRADSISTFMSRTRGGAGATGHPAAESQEPASGTGSYELLKASLLQRDGTGNDAGAHSIAVPDGGPAEEIEPVDAPEPIDLDRADANALKQAIEGRDRYIGYLIRKLRASELAGKTSGNWRELESVPVELRNRLEDYERRLDEALRRAEVELSLERARLSREATRLRLLEQQIASERKRSQMLADNPLQGRAGARPAADEDGKSGRWLRMLGIGRDDGEEDDDE